MSADAKKPILRTGRSARHATWLELFYDLIFVVVIARLAHLITHPHGDLSHDYAMFAALFVPVWWAWTGHTMFQNRFDPGDVPHTLLTLGQMLFVCFMAVFIDQALDSRAAAFALCYAAVRFLLVAMYWRVHRTPGRHRSVTGLFIGGFSLGASFWLASAFVPKPYMFALWTLGLCVDFAIPWICQRRLAEVSVHASHLPERLGLLTIIVLGESVLGVVTGLDKETLGAMSLVAALAGFVLLGSIWWLYFHALERTLMNAEYGSGQLAIYGHLPVYIGLVTVAAGVLHGITGQLGGAEYAILLNGGMLLFLIPLQVIYGVRTAGARRRQFIVTNLVLDAVLAALACFGGPLGAGGLLVCTSALYLVYTVVETPRYAVAR